MTSYYLVAHPVYQLVLSRHIISLAGEHNESYIRSCKSSLISVLSLTNCRTLKNLLKRKYSRNY